MELANVWFYSVGGPLLLPPPDSRRTRTKRTGRPRRRRRRRTISQLEPFPLFLSSGILNISLSRSIYRTRGGICKRDDPFGRAASDRPTDRPSVRRVITQLVRSGTSLLIQTTFSSNPFSKALVSSHAHARNARTQNRRPRRRTTTTPADRPYYIIFMDYTTRCCTRKVFTQTGAMFYEIQIRNKSLPTRA